MSFQFFRRFFYETHLWLGVVSGIILFVVCLSGSIFVFREEAQHFAEPAKYYVDVPKDAMSLSVDELIAKVEAAKPTMKVASITVPEKPNRTVTMMLASPNQGGGSGNRGGSMERGERRGRGEGGERAGRGNPGEGEKERGERPERNRSESAKNTEGGVTGQIGSRGPHGETTAPGQGPRPGSPSGNLPQGGHGGGGGRSRSIVYVNPYTGSIVGEGANVVDPFFLSMMRLHRFLWLPMNVGRPIVGIATIIFVVICLSGLVLWLPRTWSSFAKWRAWKPGFRIRFKKVGWPLVYDLHNTVGFYLLIPSLILALTGLCWSFSWYRDATSYVLGDQVFKQRMQRPEKIELVENPTKPLSVGEMISRQNKLTPGPGEISVTIPQDDETAMVIQKGRTGFFALSIKDKTQWDRFRGTVVPVEHYGKTVDVERFVDKPLGAKIAVSIRAIHFGDITGLSSKIFFFVVCLFATSWPITGVALWIKKLRVRSKQRKAARDAAHESGTVQAHPHHQPVEETPTNVGQTV